MTGGEKVKLIAKHSNTEIRGTLKYSNEDIFIVQDDWTGTENIYPTRCYTLERMEGKHERTNTSKNER